MGFSNFDASSRQMFWGNVLLVVCCAFYLAWWLLAFKPMGAVRGMASGWLLLPASVAGVAAVVLTVRGIGAATAGAAAEKGLFPSHSILWGGIAAYVLLLVVTVLLLRRPATTELILIVGWAMLALSEIDALYGAGRYSQGTAVGFAVVIGGAALVSLVCYVLYYGLSSRAGYYDGMVPLLLAGSIMAGISVRMAV